MWKYWIRFYAAKDQGWIRDIQKSLNRFYLQFGVYPEGRCRKKFKSTIYYIARGNEQTALKFYKQFAQEMAK